MRMEEITTKREYIYTGKIIRLRKDEVKLSDGGTSLREIVEHNGGVGIVAINENNEIILVRQYRKPFEEVLTEIPAGKIEGGEEPYSCAVRELEEETGNRPLKLELMAVVYPTPGFCNEKLHIYFCNRMTEGSLNFDDDENLEIEYVPYDKAVEMIYSGKIKDAKTIAGIFMAKRYM